MKTLNLTLSASLIALMTGCANETPLMFLSKTTIGVEVSSPSAGGSEMGLNLGFKTIDTAYIPVVEIIDTGKQLNVVSSSNLTAAPPPASRPDSEVQAEKEIADSIAETASKITDITKKLPSASEAQQQVLSDELKKYQVNLVELTKAQESLPGRRDALSVFSVIDSNSFGRSSEAGIGVGKIFATGLAAQYAAENYRSPYSACTRELVQAATALSTGTEDQKKLAAALAEICPAKK